MSKPKARPMAANESADALIASALRTLEVEAGGLNAMVAASEIGPDGEVRVPGTWRNCFGCGAPPAPPEPPRA